MLNPLVYPKVKVRAQQDQDDQHVFPDYLSPEEEDEDRFEGSSATISKSYRPNRTTFFFTKEISNIFMPKISVIQRLEKESEKMDGGESRQKLRASSVPPPRAVLSSPDNDHVIKNSSRTTTENRRVIQNRHRESLCKHVPKSQEQTSANSQEPEEVTDDKKLRGQRGSGVKAGSVSTQRRQVRTRKPGFTKKHECSVSE